MTNARVLAVTGTVALVLSITLVTGCTGGPPDGPVSPGAESGALGGMEVVGYLANADGAWTVFDSDPNESDGSGAEALATLKPGSVDLSGIEALDGRYIWASGRSTGGAADGPEIRVDGIDVAVEPQ